MKKREKVLNEMAKRWGGDPPYEFTAQFHFDSNNESWFRDVSKADGTKIVLPDSDDPKVYIPGSLELSTDHPYKIKVDLAPDEVRVKFDRPYQLQLAYDTNPKPLIIEPRELVNGLRQQIEKAADLKSMVDRIIESISNEINRSPATFILELIQNADDYPDKKRPNVHIRFTLQGEFLVITHTGSVFTHNNVTAICRANAGHKRYDIESTGFKGIGFKSIFGFSSLVYVKSGSYCFRFDKRFYTDENWEQNAWQISPIWTEKDDLPETLRSDSVFMQAKVSFAIALNENRLIEIHDTFYKTFRDDRPLVFLRNLKKVIYRGKGQELSSEISKKKWIFSNPDPIEVPVEMREYFRRVIEVEKNKRVPIKYLELRQTKIKFAVTKEGNHIKPMDNSCVHVYLPTKVDLGFPFLMNGDFIPDGSREKIWQELDWNILLFEKAGYEFVNWIADLTKTYDLREVLKVIPNFNKKDISPETEKFTEAFEKGFRKGMEEVKWVPDANGKLHLIYSLYFDYTGFSEAIGHSKFKEIFGTEINLASHQVSQSRITQKLLKFLELENYLDFNHLKARLDTEEFKAYLLKPHFNELFLVHLMQQNKLESFSEEAIYLNRNQQLNRADKLYKYQEELEAFSFLDVQILFDYKDLNLIKAIKCREYEVLDFIESHIIAALDNNYESFIQKDHNKTIFRYLKENQDEITPGILSDLKQLPSHGLFNIQINKFNEPVYIPCKEVEKLLEIKSISREDVYLIDIDLYSQNEAEKEEWIAFFSKRFDVEKWTSEGALEYLIKYLGENSNYLRDKYLYLDRTERIVASGTLLKYFYSLKGKVNEDIRKEYKKTGGKIPVVTTSEAGELRSLSDCYLSKAYTENDALEKLVDEIKGSNIEFISDEYLSMEPFKGWKWNKILQEFGIQSKPHEFLKNAVLPKVDEFEEENLLGITLLLFESRVKLKDSLLNAPLKVKTSNGSFISTEAAIIGPTFGQNLDINTILPDIKIVDTISEEYLEFGGEEALKSFFKLVGCRDDLSEEEIIDLKVNKLKEIQGSLNKDAHFSLVEDISRLYKEDKLSASAIDKCRHLQLYTNNIDRRRMKPENLYFPPSYKVQYDLSFVKKDACDHSFLFVSSTYINRIKDRENLVKLFKEIGITDGLKYFIRSDYSQEYFPEDYLVYLKKVINEQIKQLNWGGAFKAYKFIEIYNIELLNQKELSIKIWPLIISSDHVLKKLLEKITVKASSWEGVINNLPNYPKFFVCENQSIPCRDGNMRKPSEVIGKRFDKLFDSKARFPIFDYSTEIYGKTLEDHLGFKTTLDFKLCLDILMQKPSISHLKEFKVISTLKELYDSEKFSFKDIGALKSFRSGGQLPNSNGDWTAVADLYYIDLAIPVYRLNHDKILHRECLGIADFLKIPKLTKDDFDYEIKNEKDEQLKEVLLSKLKYVAVAQGGIGGFEELQRIWIKRVEGFNFKKASSLGIRCKKISPPIEYNEKTHLIHANTFYYLGSWKSVRAKHLIDYLITELLKTKISESLFIDILEFDEKIIMNQFKEKNIAFPEEWLSTLSMDDCNTRSNGTALEPSNQYGNDLQDEEALINTAMEASKKLKLSHYLDQAEIQELEELLNRSLTEDEMENIWMVALFRAIHYYEKEGFDLSNLKMDMEAVIEAKQFPEINHKVSGESKNVFIRSAKGGLLYLKYHAFFELQNESTELFVVIGNSENDNKIFTNQGELLAHKDDDLIARIPKAEKESSLSTILSKDLTKSDYRFTPFYFFFRIGESTLYESIFAAIHDQEKKNESDDWT